MNEVVLAGRLTKNIELKTSGSGNDFAPFTLAVKGYNDHTDFINCVAFGKLAETMERYVHKGDQVIVCGSIRTSSSTDESGQKRYYTNVAVRSMDFGAKKQGSDSETYARSAEPERSNKDYFASFDDDDEFDYDDEDLPF